jgi:transketolase
MRTQTTEELFQNAESMTVDEKNLGNVLRFLSVDAIEAAQSGHPGFPLGMADIVSVLFQDYLTFYAPDPLWPNRDRLILSAGHGCMLLYGLLYVLGYPGWTLDQLKRFRQLNSQTPGHPELNLKRGIETTSGPLGQGFANGVGMAFAEQIKRARFGDSVIQHKTCVLASDGDFMEGISHEVASFAGHYRLGQLIVLYDDNQVSIDGPLSLTCSDQAPARFASYGWRTMQANGHDFQSIRDALSWAWEPSDQPALIAFQTQIGHGSPNREGTCQMHGTPLGSAELSAMREHLHWPHAPFHVPDAFMKAWRQIGVRSAECYRQWIKSIPHAVQAQLNTPLVGAYKDALNALKSSMIQMPPAAATRYHSQQVLNAIAPHIPSLVGGSADLTPSNNTKSSHFGTMTPTHFKGQYVHYGIREHGMAGIMNGLSLHGGLIPYGGTFLVFSDYLRPAIRLAAMMKQGVIYVLTHDSIGVGEDGPTHQPIEHLWSLRLIPNVWVLRPADGIEVAECWEIALDRRDGPTVLALSRQTTDAVRLTASSVNLSKHGGYIVRHPFQEASPRITLMATGSEVGLAIRCQSLFEQFGLSTQVVSIPCLELFREQSYDYRQAILAPQSFHVVIEAGKSNGWHEWVQPRGLVIGIDTFGQSAPAQALWPQYGMLPKLIVERVIACI